MRTGDDDRLACAVHLPAHPQAKRPDQEVTPQVTPQVTPEVRQVLEALALPLSRQELQQALGLKDIKHFRTAYLRPALASGLVEMTLPDKPQSSKQGYRLTTLGRQWQQQAQEGEG